VPADVPERITGPVNQGGFDDVDFMMLLSSGTPQEGTLPSLDYSLDQQPVDDIPWLQWPETAIAQTDTRSLPFIVSLYCTKLIEGLGKRQYIRLFERPRPGCRSNRLAHP
jgi:hypothetical protein